MSPDVRAAAERALHSSRFRLFTAWLTPLCGLFTLVYLGAAASLGEARFAAAGLLALVLGAASALGHRQAAAGQLTRAVWTVGGALLAVAFSFSFVLPFAFPTLVLMPVTAVALVLPYLEGRSLRAFALSAAFASLGSACAGLLLRGPSGVPPALERLVLLGTLAIAVSLTLLLLWQFSSRLREALAQVREADARKSDFLAVLSHELRNPLASIRNAAELLSRTRTPGPMAAAQAAVIERESAHVARLLEDLLDTARVGRGELLLRREPLSVEDLLARSAELVRPLLAERATTLTVAPGPEGLGLEGDPVRLVQVLANLLHNAVKFTPPGGRIWLTARGVDGEVELEVRDSGEGLTADERAHIFEPFVQGGDPLTRAHGGLGLGLSLVRQLVTLHQGRVWAHSEGPGRGATFTVRLPALPQPVARRAPAEESEDARAQEEDSGARPQRTGQVAGRVLVVDDNVNAARSLALLVQLWGYEVEVVHDGAAALARAKQWTPTHVVLDIGLPRMDGYALARQLRQLPSLAGARLFALTGYGQEEHRQRAREAGFEQHFTKPVHPDLLARALGSAAPAAPARTR